MKLMIYANHTMLFLCDTSTSLREAMTAIRKFGEFSALVINWTKSSIMLLDVKLDLPLLTIQEILLSGSFRNLGIQVTPYLQDLI